MTKIGYDDILNRIHAHPVLVPDDMTTEQLQSWFEGYSQSQRDVINIIEELKKGGERA